MWRDHDTNRTILKTVKSGEELASFASQDIATIFLRENNQKPLAEIKQALTSVVIIACDPS